MKTKTKIAKTKIAAAVSADASHDAIASDIEKFQARIDSAKALIAVCTNATPKADVLKYNNTIKYCAQFVASLQGAKYAETWTAYGLNADKVGALAWYAQQKVHAICKALSAGIALSAVRGGPHANNMTQYMVRVLREHGMLSHADVQRKMHDLDTSKTLGTISTQATTSRQALETFAFVTWNRDAKTFGLSDSALEHMECLAQ